MTDTRQAIIKKEKIASETDGLEISILLCGPAACAPKGIVQIVHGMCEHKERYIPFMEFLAANGFFSIIHDHRGHGESVRSSEDLGYFYEGGWEAMVDDIKAVTERVRKEHPDLPLILLGHSMGSMAVRSFAKRYDNMTSGLIVCGSPSRNHGAGIGKLVARTYAARAGENAGLKSSSPWPSARSTGGSSLKARQTHGSAQTLKSSGTTTTTLCATSSLRPMASSTSSPSCRMPTASPDGDPATRPCRYSSSPARKTPAC